MSVPTRPRARRWRAMASMAAATALLACAHDPPPPTTPVAAPTHATPARTPGQATPVVDARPQAPVRHAVVRVATFNIQRLGPTKAGRADVMAKLAAIIGSYDLVAVQEIVDKAQRVPTLLLEAINADGPRYALVLSPRTGQQPDDLHSQEQYAYYYRTGSLRPVGDHGLYDDSAHDHFQREPHVARFEVLQACETFVLMNLHTRPKAAVSEIAAVEHVFAWARQQYADERHFVALGDFNAGCGYASEQDLDALPLHGEAYDWVVPHSADTNLAKSQCPYDRIVVQSTQGNLLVGDWGVDHAFEDRRISDHYPVWADFRFPIAAACDGTADD